MQCKDVTPGPFFFYHDQYRLYTISFCIQIIPVKCPFQYVFFFLKATGVTPRPCPPLGSGWQLASLSHFFSLTGAITALTQT